MHLKLLPLKRKPYDEISWSLLPLFIIEKYEETRFKNSCLPCYFLSSWGQKIKNITKLEQTRLFLFTFLVTIFILFLEQKLIYTINIGFKFVFGLFLEWDFLQKHDLHVHVPENRNLCSPKMQNLAKEEKRHHKLFYTRRFLTL